MKIVHITSVIIAFFLYQGCSAAPTLSVILRRPSSHIFFDVQQRYSPDKVASSLHSYVEKTPPSKLSHKLAQGSIRNNQLPHIGGFLALYAGYSNYSDDDGSIEFPLSHTSPKLYLLITKKILFEKIQENTVSHLKLSLENDAPADLYKCEKKTDENGILFWDVTKEEIPKDGKVNPLTLIILTNPANIFVPTGHFMASNSKQLVIPPLYVVGSVENEEIILSSLDIKQYFEPIEVETKKDDKKALEQKIITNS